MKEHEIRANSRGGLKRKGWWNKKDELRTALPGRLLEHPPEKSAFWLERGHCEAGWLALAGHGGVAVEAVQGDLGWSSCEARKARSKVAYEGRLRLMSNKRWVRRVFRYAAMKTYREHETVPHYMHLVDKRIH
ncbi:hypothetical protein HPB50_027984 [Hyalomma asiaticum]|nr:hypothetical protein HPB50_027984 [Hyalomma asiaticum]